MIFAGLGAWVLAQMLEAATYSEATPSLVEDSTREIDDITHSLPYYAMAIRRSCLR
jgi:hypothetical protein